MQGLFLQRRYIFTLDRNNYSLGELQKETLRLLTHWLILETHLSPLSSSHATKQGRAPQSNACLAIGKAPPRVQLPECFSWWKHRSLCCSSCSWDHDRTPVRELIQVKNELFCWTDPRYELHRRKKNMYS